MLRNTVVTPARTKEFAKELRRDRTPGERAFWKKVQAKKFHGLKFRREVPIGPFIVDFLCVEKKLIVEIDGRSHWTPEAKAYDARRDEYLRRHGFTVLRFGNRQTVTSIGYVLSVIAEVLGFRCE